MGGAGRESCSAIALTPDGEVAIVGSSDSADFPTTPGSFQPEKNSEPGPIPGLDFPDAAAAVLNADGSDLVYGSYIGGAGDDFASAVAIDPTGKVWLGGGTSSADFPVTPDADQSTPLGDSNGWIARFDPGSAAAALRAARLGRREQPGEGAYASFMRAGERLVAMAIIQGKELLTVVIEFRTSFDRETTLALLILTGEQSSAIVAEGIGVTSVATMNGDAVLGGTTNSLDGTDADAAFLNVLFSLGEPPPPTTTANAGSNNGVVGEPVSTATGEMYATRADLALRGSFPMAFVRYYASLLNGNGVSSAVGANWMHNFDMKLAVENDRATVTLFRGKQVPFRRTGNAWDLVVAEQFDYQLADDGSGFQFYDAGVGMILKFFADGSLTRMEDLNGNGLTITQSAEGAVEIADGLGRRLTLTYANGKLSQIQDHGGRVVRYVHEGDNLVEVVDARGGSTRYAYTSAGERTALLTSKISPEGNIRNSQAYDSQGRAVEQTDSAGNTGIFGRHAAPRRSQRLVWAKRFGRRQSHQRPERQQLAAHI